MGLSEFEEMKPIIENAALGSYLIFPLRFSENTLDINWIQKNCEFKNITTMDLNEQIKTMFDPQNPVHAGVCYTLSPEYLIQEIDSSLSGISPATNKSGSDFAVIHKEKQPSEIDWNKNQFQITSLHLAIFQTETAFLALGIQHSTMETLLQIRNPGYANSISKYYYKDTDGTAHEFSLDSALLSLLGKAGLQPFFQSGTSLFLEAFTYNIAVISKRFYELESIRQITFNQHRMTPLTLSITDESEADLHYVYAVKDQIQRTYRWGTCVSSQTLSYIVADPDMNITQEMKTQAEDGLPLVFLALYEKYTCLHFTELLSTIEKKQMFRLRNLKKKMLEFKAFGTVHPANISRWHNVKMIYQYLLETNGITEAIDDIDIKISILSEHQHAIEAHRNDTIMGLITIFGVVSILASVLSIIQILNSGHLLEWIVTILTSIGMLLIAWIAYLWDRRH